MSGVMVLETLTCVAGHKRKAAEADLPDRDEAKEAKSCERKSVLAVLTQPVSLSADERAYQFFEHMWSLYLRPELEKEYGIAPPLPHISLLKKQVTGAVSLEDIPEPEITPVEELTHGGGLDEYDSECALTQPIVYSDCSCKDCTVAATQTIDQFSDSEHE
jgi:hypothetical protein